MLTFIHSTMLALFILQASFSLVLSCSFRHREFIHLIVFFSNTQRLEGGSPENLAEPSLIVQEKLMNAGWLKVLITALIQIF